MESRFFVEMPGDEHGNTGKKPAVVEATVELRNGRELLVPVAPEHFVNGWPTGWYRDSFGGWAEVDGPARMLAHDEYKELIASLSEETKAATESGMAKLRNGATVPKQMVPILMLSLEELLKSDFMGFYEIVALCRDPQHKLFGSYQARLQELSLVEPTGQPHDITRDIVLAATEGDDFELRLVNPLAG